MAMSYIKPAAGLPKAAKDMLVPENIRAGVRIKSNGVDVTGGIIPSLMSFKTTESFRPEHWLYWYGADNMALTGGWITYNIRLGGSDSGGKHPIVTHFSDHENISLSGGYYGGEFGTVNLINWSGYSKIHLVYQARTASNWTPYSFTAGAFDKTVSAWSNNLKASTPLAGLGAGVTATEKCLCESAIDVEQLNGAYIFALCMYTQYSPNVDLYAVWME